MKKISNEAELFKNMRALAYLAMCVALIAPLLSGGIGLIPAKTGDYFAGKALIAILVSIAAIDIVCRASLAWKAYGRLLVGIVALLWTANFMLQTPHNEAAAATAFKDMLGGALPAAQSTAKAPAAKHAAVKAEEDVRAIAPETARQTAVFLQNVRKIQGEFQDKVDVVDREAATIDFTDALTPASLTNQDKLNASTLLLARHARLIKERGTLYDQYMENTEEFLRTADLPEAQRQEIVWEFVRAKDTAGKHFADLENAQLETVDVLWDLFNFAKRVVGSVTALNGTLQFSHAADADRYNALVRKLNASLKVVDAAEEVFADDEKAWKKTMASAYETARH